MPREEVIYHPVKILRWNCFVFKKWVFMALIAETHSKIRAELAAPSSIIYQRNIANWSYKFEGKRFQLRLDVCEQRKWTVTQGSSGFLRPDPVTQQVHEPTQTRSLTATRRCKNEIFTPSVWQWRAAQIITFKGRRRRQQVFFIKRWIQHQCHPVVGLSQHSHTDDDRRKCHYLPYRLLPLSSVIISSSSPASFAPLRGAGG